MEIEDKKTFTVGDTTIKLQVVTAADTVTPDREHFFVMLQDYVCHVSVAFETMEDADACFGTFLKMKTV